MLRRLFVVASFALLASLAAHAAKRAPAGPVDIWLNAAITVGEDGRIQALEWSRQRSVHRMIADRVEPAVRQWHFEPGQVNGVPAKTQTFLHLRFKGLPGPDGGMNLAFVSADTGASAQKMIVPSYPNSAMHGGYPAVVVAIVDFSAEGKPSLRSYDYYGDKDLEKDFVNSTRDAVARWKADLEHVGGRPVAASMRVPVSFCVSECLPIPRDDQDTPLDAGRAVALGSAVKLLDARDPLAGS